MCRLNIHDLEYDIQYVVGIFKFADCTVVKLLDNSIPKELTPSDLVNLNQLISLKPEWERLINDFSKINFNQFNFDQLN